MHENVLGMTLVQPNPILVAEDVEVQVVKFCEVEIGELLSLLVLPKFGFAGFAGVGCDFGHG
jgi:hypothetical protein